MRLAEFRVQMYRSIIDSSWVKVNSLTVVVGKNESGKTTLLKALHKLRPFSPEPYSMDSEWPSTATVPSKRLPRELSWRKVN